MKPSVTSRSGLTVIIGIGASESERPHLREYVHLASQISVRLNPATDRVVFNRVDWDSVTFSDQSPPDSSLATLRLLVREMKALPKKNGARPAQFWKSAAERSEESGAVVVLYFGDADDEDPDPNAWRTYVDAGNRLYNNDQVKKVIFCGAERTNRARLERIFAPLGRERLLILGPAEMRLDTLTRQIEAARL